MFRNRAAAAPVEPPADRSPSDNSSSAGKGRPTPSRKQALSERQARVRTSLDPKEASRQERARRRRQRAKIHEAQLAGDERYLPQRDRGPVRKFVRDLVDSRRSPGEYFLYTAAAMLGISFIDSASARAASTLILLALSVAALVDSIILSRRIRRELADRFPGESTKGAVSYGVVRSLQVRRLRLPAAQATPPSEGLWQRWRERRRSAAEPADSERPRSGKRRTD